MSDMLNTGISGLLAFQRMINTTSHNISNSATDGFSRQRVNLENRLGAAFGNGFVGSGVNVRSIERISDDFLIGQLRETYSEAQRLDTLNLLASQIDNAVADAQGSVAPLLQTFFESVNDAAANPSSLPARQIMLTDAENLSARFQFLDTQFDQANLDANNRISSVVQEINTLSENIAAVNNDIQLARAQSGQTPNDLIDQRDTLVKTLAGYIGIRSVQQDDDTVNVYTGNGQALVTVTNHRTLTTLVNNNDPSQVDIAIATTSGNSVITSTVSGGDLGGVLDFRRDLLHPAMNQLGRLAIVLADTFNQQHQQGIDLTGNLGGTFFNIPTPNVLTSAQNTGTAVVTASIDDTLQLTAADYSLRFDGSNYTLTNEYTGVNSVGVGPTLSLEGITVNIAGTAVAGDRFLVQPSRQAAGRFSTQLTDASQIAMAMPIKSAISTSNTGDATANIQSITNVNDANLLNNVEIRFNVPASTYDVVDVTLGATLASGVTYTSGDVINVNGYALVVSGVPDAGDVFTISENTDGSTDNRNGNLLADLQNGLFIQGAANYQEAYALMVGEIGAITRQVGINATAQSQLLESVEARRDSLSGVNLDEEAVNLVRYQQAFQAAAQIITISEELFDTLLASMR